MNNHPLIGRTLERADTGETLGVIAHIYGGDADDYPWAVIVMDDSTFGVASLCPQSAWRVRMEPAPAPVEPASVPERVVARPVKGDCASGDGTAYMLTPRAHGIVCVTIEAGGVVSTAFVPRADYLAAAGLRGDL